MEGTLASLAKSFQALQIESTSTWSGCQCLDQHSLIMSSAVKAGEALGGLSAALAADQLTVAWCAKFARHSFA